MWAGVDVDRLDPGDRLRWVPLQTFSARLAEVHEFVDLARIGGIRPDVAVLFLHPLMLGEPRSDLRDKTDLDLTRLSASGDTGRRS